MSVLPKSVNDLIDAFTDLLNERKANPRNALVATCTTLLTVIEATYTTEGEQAGNEALQLALSLLGDYAQTKPAGALVIAGEVSEVKDKLKTIVEAAEEIEAEEGKPNCKTKMH